MKRAQYYLYIDQPIDPPAPPEEMCWQCSHPAAECRCDEPNDDDAEGWDEEADW